jgi:hypothetical protein
VGLSYALPTTIFVGALTGAGGAKYDVGSGAYNRKIDERIADIRSTCRIRSRLALSLVPESGPVPSGPLPTEKS